MRAITINERINHFERGLNPKAAMGVGGLTLDNAYDTIIKAAIEKWDAYLQKNLVGKRISGKFLRFNGKNWEDTENITFRVNRIVNWEVEGDINVKDDEDNTYAININQKIHIG
jgi:hypothetical protein